MKLSREQIKNIIISFVTIFLVAGLGSLFVNLGMKWFDGLVQPSEWIPNIVIPIVWTIIYIAFAIINYLWIKKSGIPKNVVVWLFINAVLNVLWCLIFFTLNQLFLGNIVIILNLVAGFVLLVNILQEEKIYGYILSIYPIWLSVATTLNLALWILN